MLKSREFTIHHFCRAKAEVDIMVLKPISNDSKLKYIDLLNFSVRKRYLEKLKIRGQVLSDLYSMSKTCWYDDMTKWPKLLFGDVYTYISD